MKKIIFLFVLVTFILNAEGSINDTCNHQPLVSHVYWITVHAREAEIYDSLYQLFVVDLQIPQLFDTETYGSKRYFAIRAGNVILEPCGPFDFHESFGQDAMTRFNTLAFRPYESAVSSAEILRNLGFRITERDQDALLNLTVDELCSDFLPVNLSKSLQVKSKDQVTIDSLAKALVRSGGGPLGLEYVEEIQIGYTSEKYLEKWTEFLHPLENRENLWILPRKPDILFCPGEREEIIALVLKVQSLEKAAQYLQSKNMRSIQSGDRIEIDLGWAHGIRIILAE